LLEYELRYLNGNDAVAVHRFRAGSDDLALILAEDAAGSIPMELWRGGKRLKSFARHAATSSRPGQP
jgi:hypothetical protein